ncbi:MAG: ATP-binding cassette domain-containing protein [Pseudomonadota bacterium]
MTALQQSPESTASDSQPALAVDVAALQFDYQGQTALRLERLTLEAKSQAVVVGPSGSGKTTLLHLLAGLIRPTSGRVDVFGQDLSALSNAACDRFRGTNIGIVFQGLHLLPSLTIRQNIVMAQRLGRRVQSPDEVDALLSQLDLTRFQHRRPSALSQGQAQRVAIARAVAHRPRLILADEPTSALDDDSAQSAIALLEETAKRVGAALLVVTHDTRIVDHFANIIRLVPTQ